MQLSNLQAVNGDEDTFEEANDTEKDNNDFGDIDIDGNDENDDDEETDTNLSNTKFHQYAFIDPFEHGNDLLKKANITQIRNQRKKRLVRSEKYHKHIYEKAFASTSSLTEELQDMRQKMNIRDDSNYARNRYKLFASNIYY